MKKIKMSFIIIILVVVAGYFIFIYQDIKKYETIVAEIKKQELKLDTIEEYKIKNFSDLSTLKKYSDYYGDNDLKIRGEGAGNIWVFKTNENLLVFIETKDYGHGGEYGVVYSENGQLPAWKWVNHEWFIGKNINKNWWKIYYNLD